MVRHGFSIASDALLSGLSGRIRTCNLRIRNPVLYPVELRRDDLAESTGLEPVWRSRTLSAFEAGPLPFRQLSNDVAPPDGVEPPTFGFGDRCSTN